MLNSKQSFRWIVVVFVLGIGGCSLAWLAFHGNSSASIYTMAKVEKGNIEETVSAVGVLQPLEYVDVGTQVTGQLKILHVALGDQVKKGALLAEIDPTLFIAAADKTKATIDNLKAQLADKLAAKHLAEQENARNKQLFAGNAASAEVLEQSTTAEVQAGAQVESLRAQIRQSQSQLVADEANLKYTKIYAPMAGTVVSLTVKEGQTLVASQQAPVLLRIADLSTMTVWAQTSEADVPKIKVGMPAYFNTLGEPARRWYGKVRQVLPTPETLNNVILYDVLFDVANSDLALKTQMSAQVFFVLAKADNVLLVPSAALNSIKTNSRGGKKVKEAVDAPAGSAKTYTVLVPDHDKTVEKTVTVGISNRIQSQVLSGLDEGDTVIVGPAVKAGSKSGGQGQKSMPGMGR